MSKPKDPTPPLNPRRPTADSDLNKNSYESFPLPKLGNLPKPIPDAPQRPAPKQKK